MAARSATGARILLVDEHAAFREPLAHVLGRQPWVYVVLEAASPAHALPLATQADVCVTELIFGGTAGVDPLPDIAAANSDARVLVLTAVDDLTLQGRAVEAGAAGVLSKGASLSEVLMAIRALAQGSRVANWPQMVALLQHARRERRRQQQRTRRLETLTVRERDVLSSLAEGLSDKEVAQRLGISVDTVRTHLANVFGKIQVESRLQAALYAVRHGLVATDTPPHHGFR
jgi:DNA-binding NarL/FixJ family response regulator